MIDVLKDYPDNVLAVEGVGKIIAEEYQDTLIPKTVRRIERHGTIRLFCVLGSRFESLAPGAAWADLKLGVSRWIQFDRLAVVTDVAWIRGAMLLFGPIYPHPMRTLPNVELEAARACILEKGES